MKLSIRYSLLALTFKQWSVQGKDACESKLVVFGDSLTDNGNLYHITGNALPPSPAYFEGRFTNGKVWVESLADLMGIMPPLPRYAATADGTNYAVAGATSGDSEVTSWTPKLTGIPTQLPSPGVRRQVNDFVADLQGGLHADLCPNSPIIIWSGTVDFIVLGKANLYKETLENLENSIEELIEGAGAKNIIVLNMAPLQLTPAAVGTFSSLFTENLPDGLSDDIAAYNNELKVMLKKIGSENKCVDIKHVDTQTILGKVATDPENYGVAGDFGTPRLDETALFTQGNLEFLNEENCFWFDGVHPTATVHDALAVGVHDTIKMNTGKKAKQSKECPSGSKKASKAPKMENHTGKDVKNTKGPKKAVKNVKGGKTAKAVKTEKKK